MAKRIDMVVVELRKREPLFHQRDLCSTRQLLEVYAAPDFWEVGASGQVYTREFALDTVEKRFQENTESDTSKWEISDFECRELGPHTYMVTYVLKQESRHTRRLSIWREANQEWQIVYHQGAIIAKES